MSQSIFGLGVAAVPSKTNVESPICHPSLENAENVENAVNSENAENAEKAEKAEKAEEGR